MQSSLRNWPTARRLDSSVVVTKEPSPPISMPIYNSFFRPTPQTASQSMVSLPIICIALHQPLCASAFSREPIGPQCRCHGLILRFFRVSDPCGALGALFNLVVPVWLPNDASHPPCNVRAVFALSVMDSAYVPSAIRMAVPVSAASMAA